MRFKVAFAIFLLGVLVASSPVKSGFAEQPREADFNQVYQTAVSKAQETCRTLWADHAFDRLRTKIPLNDQRPTFSQLKNTERLSAKERPIADLAIKVVEKCRTAYQPVYALLPPQMLKVIEGIQRQQDAKIAELYNRKITYGEFNISMDELTGDVVGAFSGLLKRPKDNEGAEAKVAKANGPIPKPEPAVRPGSHLALVIGNSAYGSLPKLSNPTNDSKAIAEALKAMGYQTKLVLDGSEQVIRREIRQFANDTEAAEVAVVLTCSPVCPRL